MKKLMFLGAAAIAMALTTAVAVAADKSINLKLSYWVPPKHKLTPGYKEWAEAIKEASNGTITVTLFPSSQLGSGRDHYDMVKRGIADFGLINPGYTPGRFPIIQTADLPFTVSDGFKSAPALHRWYKKYAAKEMPDLYICHVFPHEPGTFHSKKAIRTPADVKGLKVRTANQTIAKYVTSMGGNSVQVPIMEAYETLKRGITDAITVPWGGNITFSFGKVVKQHLDAPLYIVTFVHGINKKLYDSMSETQKKAVDSVCTPEWSQRIYRHWAQQERELKAKIVADKGHTINKIGKAELNQWRAAAKPVVDAWRVAVKKTGNDPDAIRNELVAELKKEGALAE